MSEPQRDVPIPLPPPSGDNILDFRALTSMRHWIEQWHANSKLRFLVSGAWNTVFGYVAFSALYLALAPELHYLLIAAIAQAIAVTQAFLFHRHFVFRSTGPWLAEFLRYNLSVTGIFVFGLGGLSLLVEFGGLNPLLAQAVVIVLTVVLSFFIHRDFSFRDRGRVASTSVPHERRGLLLKIAGQFRRYMLVGGLAFVVDYMMLFLLATQAGFHYQIAAAIAFLCGLIVNYTLCVSWIFDHRSFASKRHEFLVFSAIGLVGLALNGFLIHLMTELAGLHYLNSKLVAAGLILVFNFSLRRHILFSE